MSGNAALRTDKQPEAAPEYTEGTENQVSYSAYTNIANSAHQPAFCNQYRIPRLFTDFCENRLSRFCVILLTNKQQTNADENITSSEEVTRKLATANNQSINQSINQFNSNLAAREPDSK